MWEIVTGAPPVSLFAGRRSNLEKDLP